MLCVLQKGTNCMDHVLSNPSTLGGASISGQARPNSRLIQEVDEVHSHYYGQLPSFSNDGTTDRSRYRKLISCHCHQAVVCVKNESWSCLPKPRGWEAVAASPRASALISRDSDSSSSNIGIPATSVSDRQQKATKSTWR